MSLRSIGIAITIGLLATGAHAQFGGGGGQVQPGQGVNKRNVLVIVMDDIGTDKLGFYGHTDPTCNPPTCQLNCAATCVEPYPRTPRLDALRRGGIWFTHAYAMPVCSPTRACIQTGRFPLRTGIGQALTDDNFELSNSEVFVSELLRNGFPSPQPVSNLPYKCGAFGKWHMSDLTTPDYGHAITNGYHRFFGSMGNVGDHYSWSKVKIDPGAGLPVSPPTIEVLNGRATGTFTTAYWQTSVTRADALTWILDQTSHGRPFFAYVCFNAAHADWTVPPASLLSQDTQNELACALLGPGEGNCDVTCDEKTMLIYRAMVEAMDTEIGALIDGLPTSVRNNTTIFVLGDNGTPNQVIDEDGHNALHGKGTVMRWGINVPLIVSGPPVPTPTSSEGWKSDAIVSVVDFWRTIRDLTGASESAVAPLTPMDSMSFFSVLQSPTSLGSRLSAYSSIFSPFGEWSTTPCFTLNKRATTNGIYTYVRRHIPGGCYPSPAYLPALYRLSTDQEEENNLLDVSGNLIVPNQDDSDNLDILRDAMDAIE